MAKVAGRQTQASTGQRQPTRERFIPSAPMPASRSMRGQEYAELLYEGGGRLPSLARAADAAASRGGAMINVAVLHSRKHPATEITEWAPDDGRPDVSRRNGKSVLTLNGRGLEPIRIAIVRSGGQPNVYYALSDCASADFEARFVSLLDSRIPTITRVHLSNEEMRGIVGAAAEICDARVRRVSTRTRRSDPEKYDSRTDRIDRPAGEFAGEGDEERCEIRAVEMSCSPAGQAQGNGTDTTCMLTVTRDCRFSASRGTGVLFGAVLPRAADLAAGRAEKLRTIARTANRRIADSLIVGFKERWFADPDKNSARIDAIGSMPHTAFFDYLSDMFMHISLVDYGDCSTYDIMALANDKLTIIPTFSATDASMSRLVNHVMEKFGDATIERYDGGS